MENSIHGMSYLNRNIVASKQHLEDILEQINKNDPNLVEVYLADEDLADRDLELLVEALDGNTHVKNVKLCWTGMGPSGAKILARIFVRNGGRNCSNIEVLDIVGDYLGQEGAKAIVSGMQQPSVIKELGLCQTSIGDAGLEYLAQALEYCSSIEILDLSDNKITDISCLGKVLPRLSKLLKLSLSHNPIGDRGIINIEKYSGLNDKKLSSLAMLELVGCEIGAEGGQSLGRILEMNASIIQLNMHNNCIGCEGMASICGALALNVTLKRLNVGDNIICREGAISIGHAFARNDTLQKVVLNGNRFGDTGAEAIMEGLALNTGLTSISIQKCDIAGRGAKACAKMLMENTTLKILDIYDNIFDKEGTEIIVRKGLYHNYFLEGLDVGDLDDDVLQGDEYLDDEIDMYLRLNIAGRRVLRDNNFPSALWPYFMERYLSSFQSDMIFYLLKENPALCKHHK